MPGYLQRLRAYTVHQDYCPDDRAASRLKWPPVSALVALVADANTSCQLSCHRNGDISEQSVIYLDLLFRVSGGASLILISWGEGGGRRGLEINFLSSIFGDNIWRQNEFPADRKFGCNS